METVDFAALYMEFLNGGAPVDEDGELMAAIELRCSEPTRITEAER